MDRAEINYSKNDHLYSLQVINYRDTLIYAICKDISDAERTFKNRNSIFGFSRNKLNQSHRRTEELTECRDLPIPDTT